MESQETADLKAELREAAARRREAAYAADPHAGHRLADQFQHMITISPGLAISGYWPLEGELDVRPLLKRLRDLGHEIGLPIVIRRHEPLLFRAWRDHDEMVEGKFKVMTPPTHAPEVTPELLLVPLLAFDPNGYRLGYGGGFYDRTLALWNVPAIGIAYAGQEVASLPSSPHDRTLDMILTEQGLRRFS